MTHTELQVFLGNTFETCLEISSRKSSDYAGVSGDALANFKASEIVGISPIRAILVRVLDKIQRIVSFDERFCLNVPNESVMDSVMDCVNYFALLGALITERTNECPTATTPALKS